MCTNRIGSSASAAGATHPHHQATLLNGALGRGTDSSLPLSQLLVNLIQAEVRLAPPPPGFQSHEAHFVPGLDQALAPYLFNQLLVAQHDFLAHPLIFALGAQAGELVVEVEHHRRRFEAARRAAGVGVKADNEERLAREAQREMRVARVVADARVRLAAQPNVFIRQRLDALGL